MIMAPAPKRAAAPIAPVRAGAAAPALLLVDVAVALAAPPPTDSVAEGMPEVYGALETLDAPGKATPAAVAVAFPGLRTLSITWTTPPAMRTSAVTTFALLTSTEPLTMRTISSVPSRVLSLVLSAKVLE